MFISLDHLHTPRISVKVDYLRGNAISHYHVHREVTHKQYLRGGTSRNYESFSHSQTLDVLSASAINYSLLGLHDRGRKYKWCLLLLRSGKYSACLMSKVFAWRLKPYCWTDRPIIVFFNSWQERTSTNFFLFTHQPVPYSPTSYDIS